MSSAPLKKFQPEKLKNNKIKCIKIGFFGHLLANPVGILSEEQMEAEFLIKPEEFKSHLVSLVRILEDILSH